MGVFDIFKRAPAVEPRVLKILKNDPAPREQIQSKQLEDAFAMLYTSGMAIEPPYPPEKLLQLADTNEVHSACLEAKATDAVGRGWVLKSDDGESDPEEKDRVEERLRDVSPDYTFQELLFQAAWELEVVGWSAWEVARSGAEVGALYPLPAHTLRATRDPDVFVQVRDARTAYFKKFGDERHLSLSRGTWSDSPLPPEDEAHEVITFRRYNPRSNFYGVPRYVSGIPTIAEAGALRDYNISFFESAGVISKLIFVISTVGVGAVIDEIEKTLKDARGRAHTNLVAELPPDAKVQVEELATAPKDQGFDKRRLALVKAILMAHSVPPYRVGLAELGSLGGGAAREMLRAYRHGVVEPVQTVVESRLQKTLFGEKGLALSKGYRFELEDLDWDETELSLKIADTGVKGGFMTPNEARQEVGRDPDPDPAMDKFYFNGRALGEKPPDPAMQQAQEGAIGVVKELRDEVRVAMRRSESDPKKVGSVSVDVALPVPVPPAKAEAVADALREAATDVVSR